MNSRNDVGAAGEEAGAAYLAENGYTIRERNYRCVYGEIDIIAENGGDLVFVEVKRRRSSAYGQPYEAVTRTKQATIARCALQYVKERRLRDRTIRFDVLSIGPADGAFELIASAFSAGPFYTQ